MFLNSENFINVQTSFEYIAVISNSSGCFGLIPATFKREQFQAEKHRLSYLYGALFTRKFILMR
jgi:hypothetical protein